MSLWSSLFGRRGQSATGPLDFIDFASTDAPIYAIGDVHGRLDLLIELEAQIHEDSGGKAEILLLGDFVDRGPETAALLDHLTGLETSDGLRFHAIRGNHEDMFLQFATDPARNRKWLDYGGDATLASYGAFGDPLDGFQINDRRLAQIVAAHVPPEHIQFLSSLPYLAMSDGYVFVHAGLDPSKPPAAQHPDVLMWSDPHQLDRAEYDFTVVHGHISVESAEILPRRINVDTGAWKTGVLTAVRIGHGEKPRLVQTGKAERA